MGRKGLAVGVILSVASAPACRFETAVPPGSQIQCETDKECPPSYVCKPALDKCISLNDRDDIPPALVGPAQVTPVVGRSGTSFTVRFEVTEALGKDPDVAVNVGGGETAKLLLDEEATTRETFTYSYNYLATGTEAEQRSAVVVDLVDAAGNAAMGLPGGEIEFDFQPPGFEGTRDLSPRNIGSGTTATLRFVLDEDVGTPPTVSMADGGGPIAWQRGPDLGMRSFEYWYTTNGSEQEGPHELTVVAVDRAGNRADLLVEYQLSISFVAANCGNGIVQELSGESCDDGDDPTAGRYNSDNWAASALVAHCNAGCTGLAPYCGDGAPDIGDEVCDDGVNDDSYGGCAADCQALGPHCGDGTPDVGFEVCDDGDTDNCTTSCDATCSGPHPVTCGDGTAECGETCDDGNTDDCVGDCLYDCSRLVLAAGCGNYAVCGGEECDDGPAGSEACATDCTWLAVYAGTGTPGDPYRIYTAKQMDTIGNTPADWVSGTVFTLMANIDLSAYTGTQFHLVGSIGNYCGDTVTGNPFVGTFDGNDFVISNFTYLNPSQDGVGLFAYVGVGGVIENVRLGGATVQGHDTVGGLVACNQGSITNCRVAVSVRTDGGWNTGGLVGENLGAITTSSVTGSVRGREAGQSASGVGGLVGCNSGSINDSNTTASVDVTSDSFDMPEEFGGLAGCNDGSITNCYATGPVDVDTVECDAVGGLVGLNEGAGSIASSYAANRVWTNASCPRVGRLIGDNDGGSYDNSYFWVNSTCSGGCNSTGIQELDNTAFYLSSHGVYTSSSPWDFVGIWLEVPGDYPRLRCAGGGNCNPLGAGDVCSVDVECQSNKCECTNNDCSGIRRCAATGNCICNYVNTAGVCTGNMTPGTDPDNDCPTSPCASSTSVPGSCL